MRVLGPVAVPRSEVVIQWPLVGEENGFIGVVKFRTVAVMVHAEVCPASAKEFDFKVEILLATGEDNVARHDIARKEDLTPILLDLNFNASGRRALRCWGQGIKILETMRHHRQALTTASSRRSGR